MSWNNVSKCFTISSGRMETESKLLGQNTMNVTMKRSNTSHSRMITDAQKFDSHETAQFPAASRAVSSFFGKKLPYITTAELEAECKSRKLNESTSFSYRKQNLAFTLGMHLLRAESKGRKTFQDASRVSVSRNSTESSSTDGKSRPSRPIRPSRMAINDPFDKTNPFEWDETTGWH